MGTAVTLLAGCCLSNRHREVSAPEFLQLAGAPLGSAFDTRFIGSTETRAYLSVWSAMPSSVGGGEDVCSCAIDDLPSEVVAKIRAGQNPWPK